MKILLLEDDQLLNKAISTYLSTVGHAVVSFRDGHEAFLELNDVHYDLLILDINVPNIDGLTLLERLHDKKIQTPTIFISAIIDIEDISRAFELGCHDYLKKPFHLKELTMRIDKLLQTDHNTFAHIRLSESYSLDIESSILRFHGKAEILSARQLKILTLLANNRSRVVEYSLFQAYAWDDIEIEIPTIRAEVNRLKKTLKEDIIINVRNMGYMIKRPI